MKENEKKMFWGGWLLIILDIHNWSKTDTNVFYKIYSLGLETDPGRMDCLLKHEEGYFHRKSKSGTKKSIQDDPYTDEHKEKIRQAIKRVNQALQMAGKESMPLHKYDFY